MMSLSVAAIITTKDREQFFRSAFESVCRQTRPVDEIVVVNDGEGDCSGVPAGVAKVIESSSALGGAAARNLGASSCRSDVLMFLDDDDEWEVGKVQAQLEILEKEPECVLVYSGREIRADDGLHYVVRKTCSKRSGFLYPEIFERNYVGVTSSVAVRRWAFDNAGGFDGALPCRQDYDLWLRLCRYGLTRWDGGYRVRYTVFRDPARQISGRAEKHVAAAETILAKYSAEISALDWWSRRRAVAEKWFCVSKANRRVSWLFASYYCAKAFAYCPHPKQLMVLLPRSILKKGGL